LHKIEVKIQVDENNSEIQNFTTQAFQNGSKIIKNEPKIDIEPVQKTKA